jgi:hypothetical protein
VVSIVSQFEISLFVYFATELFAFLLYDWQELGRSVIICVYGNSSILQQVGHDMSLTSFMTQPD